MAYTADQALDLAAQRSNLNDATLIPEAEQLEMLSAAEQRIFIVAARENPDFFGEEANTNARASSTDSWDLTSAPGSMAAVSKVEVSAIVGTVTGISSGDEVNVISIRDPDVALSPRVYMRGRKLYEYSSELQDDSSNYVSRLKIYYSDLPTAVTDTGDSLTLPSEFINLVVLPVASIFALRDQRPDEAALLEQQFQLELATFIEHVSVYDEVTLRDLNKIEASSNRLEG